MLLRKLLNNKIDNSAVFNHVNFKMNHHNIRSKELIFITHYSKIYLAHYSIKIHLSVGSNTIFNNNLFL